MTSIFGAPAWRRVCSNLIQYIFTFRFSLSLFSTHILSLLAFTLKVRPLYQSFYEPNLSKHPYSTRGCRQRLCRIWLLGIASRPLVEYSYTFVSAKINFVARFLGGFHSSDFVLISRQVEVFVILFLPAFFT